MKLKSILASVSACAIAVSAMALSASAALTNGDADGNYVYDIMADGIAPTDVYGAQLVFEMADGWQTDGAGGGLIYNSDSTGWASTEWGFSGEGENVKDVPVTVDGNTITLTLLSDTAVFVSSDTYAQIVCQAWWGADATVVSLNALDAAGNVLGEVPVETTTTTEETTTTTEETTTTAEETTTAGEETTTVADETTTVTEETHAPETTTTTTTATAPQAGDAGVGLAVAGLTLAGAAAVVLRKKH